MFRLGNVQKAIAVACLLASGGTVFAQGSKADLKDLSDAAQFVVHTRVSKVQYRMSEAAAGQPALPHTLVTYDIVRPLRGNAGSAQITLRYVGGPDGRGRILRTSNMPVFQAGDEDILFVQENGTSGCALARCIDGRFRVLNGAVYDGRGTPVLAIEGTKVTAAGKLPAEFSKLTYPRPAFDELLQNPGMRESIAQHGLTVDQARARYEAQAPATIKMTIGNGNGNTSGGDAAGATSASPSAAERQPVTVDTFVAVLSGLPASVRPAAAFQSADANAPIAAPSNGAAAPLHTPVRSAASRRSAEELAEERSLPRTPAIPRKGQ